MTEEVSLKEYLERRLVDMEQALKIALAAAEKAVDKAEAATDKRFDSVNEFRGQLNDQANKLLGRDEYHTAHQSLIEKIDTLTTRVAAIEGRSRGQASSYGFVVGAIGIIIAIISLVLAFKN